MPKDYQKRTSNKSSGALPAAWRTGAAYIRVSTDDQLEYSPESQLEVIQDYCRKNKILLPEAFIFIEQEGRSGRKSANRIEFQRMIATAKTTPRPFDVIVLWEFSRFARNQDESTFYKSMLRKKLGIDVESVKEPIPQGMYGRLIEMIIEWQDEFYSVNLSTEVKRSMLSRAKKGLYNGKMPLGYTKAHDSMPEIEESEAHIVKTIFNMWVTGYDRNYIVRWLNEHGYTTKTGKRWDSDGVKYILENPFYIGKVRWNRRQSSNTSLLKSEQEWIIADGHHDPLIDQETWDAAQAKTENILRIRNKYAHPVSHGRHWLSGMVKCSICGKSLAYKAAYRRKNGIETGDGFQCLGYRQGLHSESQFISERKLSAAVLSSLHEVLDAEGPLSFDLVQTTYTDADMEKQMYETELASLDRKAERIKQAYINEIDSLEEYRYNREMLTRRREDLLKKLQDLQTPAPQAADYMDQFLSSVASVIEVIESDAPYELKGEALRSIVRRIVFYKDTQTLEFHYHLSI